jgi:hypothetical protein
MVFRMTIFVTLFSMLVPSSCARLFHFDDGYHSCSSIFLPSVSSALMICSFLNFRYMRQYLRVYGISTVTPCSMPTRFASAGVLHGECSCDISQFSGIVFRLIRSFSVILTHILQLFSQLNGVVLCMAFHNCIVMVCFGNWNGAGCSGKKLVAASSAVI